MKPKILITGTGGFIFGNFIRYAIHNKLPYSFVSVDKVKKSSVLYNIYTNKNHKFYIGDISDPHFMNVVFEVERPDIVINGAAESHVDTSIGDANPFILSNVLGTQVVIDCCIRWEVGRLIQISTDEVMGHLEDDNAASLTEEAPLNPRNPYSASKGAGELLIKAAHETHGLNYQITRSCNNYGPRQDVEKLIPKIIKNIIEGQKIPVYGQGLQIRDWLHVDDKCSAIYTLLKDGALNETYNISANQELPNIEVVQRICNVFEKGHDLIEFVKDRPGHDFRYSVNSNKLRELGWKPQYKFNDIIPSVIQWYMNNKWWFKN